MAGGRRPFQEAEKVFLLMWHAGLAVLTPRELATYLREGHTGDKGGQLREARAGSRAELKTLPLSQTEQHAPQIHPLKP